MKYQNDTWIDCSCLKQKRINNLIESSGISEEFLSKRFDNFSDDVEDVVKDAKESVLDYFTNFRKNRETGHNSIALLGQSGYGKTHLLMAVANALLKKGIEVLYVPWVDLEIELRRNYNEVHPKIQRLQQAEVLFIDDLLKNDEQPSKTVKKNLHAIFDYRYLNKLPFLICSESTIDDLYAIDIALASRIAERCAKHLVEIVARNPQEAKILNYRLRALK